MHMKKFYVRENDESLEDDQEITFLFDSNCKEPNDKVNKWDFLPNCRYRRFLFDYTE